MLSAFFSGVESSYFSVSKIEQKRLCQLSNSIKRLYAHSNRLLIAILIANTVVNVMIASAATVITLDLIEQFSWIAEWTILSEIVIIWLLVLIFGEVLPKIFCYKHADFIIRKSASLMEVLVMILFPIIIFIEFLGKIFSHNKNEDAVTKKEINDLVDSGKLSLDVKHKKLMKNILRFPDTKIAQVMVPRVDIVAVEIGQTPQEVTKVIVDSGYSRIPVFQDDIDNILGFIYAKDIILQGVKSFKIDKLMREAVFVTENMSISKVLNLFKKGRKHMAVVVNEYGGTCGIVTMEDVLEELVGEILDESDTEEPMVTKLKDGYKINGLCNLYFLNEEFGLELPADEYDNVSEYVYDKLDKVPSSGDFLSVSESKILKIEEITDNRINYLILKEKR